MATAKLAIMVESACNLYNSDGVLAGKSDPYVIVEVPGQEGMKLQTEVIDNELNPVWNFVGEIAGFMDGDILRFTVMDKDAFPNPDDFLGKAELTAQDVYPNGFHGELTLADSKTEATLSVRVAVIGWDELAPALFEGEGVQMMVPGEMVESSTVEVLASGISAQGLPMYHPLAITTTTTTSHSMTYSAPQTDSITCEAPQVAVPSDSVMTTEAVVQHPSVAVTDEECLEMERTYITYEAPQAPVPSESVAATGKVARVVVYPAVTVTAEEFAKIKGTILTEPLPVTEGLETVTPGIKPEVEEEVEGPEMVFAGTKREVDFNETEAVDETVKIKKKSKRYCC